MAAEEGDSHVHTDVGSLIEKGVGVLNIHANAVSLMRTGVVEMFTPTLYRYGNVWRDGVEMFTPILNL